jgi:RNA polymerase sigma factor (sigma-70 family)
MTETDWLAERFEAHRSRLRAVAYRMLGSTSEADDAIQEAWLRVSRADCNGVENFAGWLTTIVSRVSLDMLRSRSSRREEPLDPAAEGTIDPHLDEGDPERDALMADSLGPALMIVLESLAPAERLTFVLHDPFGVPYDEIAPILGHSSAAARQLASRARRRVRGAELADDASHDCQREVVQAFLAASRNGDFAALLSLLDPDAVLRADSAGDGGVGRGRWHRRSCENVRGAGGGRQNCLDRRSCRRGVGAGGHSAGGFHLPDRRRSHHRHRPHCRPGPH